MGSSEYVDSGKVSGQRSSFSQTCTLLSQYLKEKGSFGDLSLGLSSGFESKGAQMPPLAPATTNGTMNLLPMIEKSGITRNYFTPPVNVFPQISGHGAAFNREETHNITDFSGIKSEPQTAQMTIFYAGQVIVFNDFPVDKAKEIMLLASKSSSQNASASAAATTPHLVQSPAESACNSPIPPPASNVTTNLIPDLPQRPPQPLASDLPIARKNSLARFLEKRKDRITSKAPYPARNSSSPPPPPQLPLSAPPKRAEKEAWLGLGAPSPFPIQFSRS